MNLPTHKTKIVATIGPASQAPETLRQMIGAGMNIARLNFSHGDFSGHRQVIENIRSAAAEAGRRVAIMADLPGPKMRIGTFGVDKIELKAGDSCNIPVHKRHRVEWTDPDEPTIWLAVHYR